MIETVYELHRFYSNGNKKTELVISLVNIIPVDRYK